MQPIIFIIHILSAVALIALVLVQHGKGADAGAGFGGGSSQTMFGSQGSTPFLIKITTLIAAVFFITSLTLGYLVAKDVKKARVQDSYMNMPFQSQAPIQVPEQSKKK